MKLYELSPDHATKLDKNSKISKKGKKLISKTELINKKRHSKATHEKMSEKLNLDKSREDDIHLQKFNQMFSNENLIPGQLSQSQNPNSKSVNNQRAVFRVKQIDNIYSKKDMEKLKIRR
jgi:hypothetical protein